MDRVESKLIFLELPILQPFLKFDNGCELVSIDSRDCTPDHQDPIKKTKFSLNRFQSESLVLPGTFSNAADLVSIEEDQNNVLSNFGPLKLISRGGFGIVYKSRHKLDATDYAIKMIPVKNQKLCEQLKEVQLNAKLQHTNIVSYKTSWIQSYCCLEQRKSINALFIQMELCGKNLKIYLDERNSIEDIHSIQLSHELEIFRQILNGLNYIHSKGLIHRDLKPSNILFSVDNEHLKIGDFGLSAYKLANDPLLPRSKGIGTEIYSAPEQLSNTDVSKTYDQRVDVYSCGIILFELAYPMKTYTEKSMVLNTLKANAKLPKNFPNNSPLISLISDMTENDFRYRISKVSDVIERISTIEKIYESLN